VAQEALLDASCLLDLSVEGPSEAARLLPVEIVLATHGFETVGGSETYLLTIGEELQRLGHGVTIHSQTGGEMSNFAVHRGLTVTVGEERLPESCDAVLVQDAGMAYALADRWPSTPQVFRACTEIYDFQFPPQLPDVVESVVVVNDRVQRRVEALDARYEIIRLRQPVNTDRFRPLVEIREQPRRAVLLGNYLAGNRSKLLCEAWESKGVECVVVGADGDRITAPEDAIASADIVVGKARAVLDGMSCGRAVYVYDFAGGDGWVTPEAYPAMEADNFGGQATDWTLSSEQLASDLDDYRPEMGLANRDLVLAHHTAADHVHALLGLFRTLNPRAEPVAAPLRELARLVRLQWITELELLGTRQALRLEAERTTKLEARVAELEAENRQLEERQRGFEELRRSVEELSTYARSVEAESAALRAQLEQRRVRAGIALGRFADRLRFHRGG
jgi:hypothetical protein